MKKVFFICVLFLGFGLTVGKAQSKKMKEKATAKVEVLNSEIIVGNKSVALSDIQKYQITEIHMERLKTLKEYRKTGSDKEEIKKINKRYFKIIFDDVLTKPQKKARKKGKEKLKSEMD